MAIILNTYCPKCSALAQRKDDLVEGHVAIRCKVCKLFWLEGDDTACIDVNALEIRAEAIQRWNEMQQSDSDDPRWTRLN